MPVSARNFARTLGAGAAAAISAAFLLSGASVAQEARAPVGPIEIVIPSSAGSTPDVLWRRAAQIWNEEKIIENPIVIQNRPGGAWTVGMNYVLERPGDENIILALAEPVFSTPIVQGTEPVYNKFTPIGVPVQTQLIVLAQPDHEANNLAELVAIAKEKPQQVKMAGSSKGSTDDQVAGLIEKAGGVDITFIPHDGGGAAQATFLGGNTDIVTVTIDEALPHMEAGKAKPLAILTEERRTEDALKDIPTAKEQGVDVVWGQIHGLVGAPDLDPAVAKWWDEKLTALVESEAWKKSIADNYLGGEYTHGEELPAFMDEVNSSRKDVLTLIGAAKS
jgi:putative tricarboxylic transport membrane protein